MRTQPQFWTDDDWKKENRRSLIRLVVRLLVLLVLFVCLLIAATFVSVKLEDQETEELEMIEEFKRGA